MKKKILLALGLLPALLWAKRPVPFEGEMAFDRVLEATPAPEVPGALMGVLVPREPARFHPQMAALGYGILARARFKTVVILYSAANGAEEGGTMPAEKFFDTPFGSLEVDEGLRINLLKQDSRLWTSETLVKNSKVLSDHMPLLRQVTRLGKIRVLPLELSLPNPETAKDMATALVRALGDLGREHDRVLLLIVGDLSKGFSSELAPYYDSRLLGALEDISIAEYSNMMEEGVRVSSGAVTFPDRGAIATGVLALNQLFAAQGRGIVYANSGLRPAAKREDHEKSLSQAVVAFTYGDVPPMTLSKDRSAKRLKDISDPLLRSLLQTVRLVVQHSLDPSTESALPLSDVAARDPLPVYVSIYKGAELMGQSGHLKAHGPLEEAVKYHALQAALHVPRGAPLTITDMPNLIFSINIPTVPDAVPGETLVPHRDGARLDYQGRGSVLLPNAWKDAPHVLVYLAELASHAGLEPWSWRLRGARVESFQLLGMNENEKSRKRGTDAQAPGADALFPYP